MNKNFEKSKLVNKLPKDDPECMYVNSMMEMSTDLLRDLCKAGDAFDKMHGVVPKCKLPLGYDFGKIKNNLNKPSIYEQKENKYISTNNQKISNSIKMEVGNINIIDEKKIVVNDIVSQDNQLSSDEDDERMENDELDNTKRDSEKVFETLNKCSSKIPKVDSLNVFKKHYGNRSERTSVENNPNKSSKKDPPDDASCTGDTEPFEDSNESVKHKPQDVIKLIELLTSSKPQVNVSAFEPVYNEIIRKRKALKMSKEEHVSQPKIAKYTVERVEDSMELRIKIIPELAKEFDIHGTLEAMKKRQFIKDAKPLNNPSRPNYVSQESLPFSTSDNTVENESKSIEKSGTSLSTQQLFSNSASTDDPNVIKKPQATAKQIFPQSTTYSNFNNNAKVAVVTGINKTSNSNTATPILCQSNQLTPKPFGAKSFNQRIINANVNEEDEQKVVEGLMAIEKLRTNVKNEYMNRMRVLDTENWLREADGYKQNAEKIKGQLDYQQMIIIAARKYLIYNYSLDVKEQNKKCHQTYLHNADFMHNIAINLNQIYKSHMLKISDQNSLRYWNLNLIRWFTMTLCMKLRAILQYRAFRNVASYCKNLHNVLRNHGIIDNDGRTNALLTENNQGISPFSVLSSYSPGRNSTRNSSPRVTTPINNRNINNSGTNSVLTLTVEMKSQLQKYIDKTKIVNNSYHDWMVAEINTVKYCKRSQRHEDAWKEIEWKIIEKTGGITINSIDESMPFVIKYLEGFLNYMNEFQKYLNPPLDSRII